MGVRTLLKKRIQDITSNITREAERLQGDSKEKFLNIVNVKKKLMILLPTLMKSKYLLI